LNEHHLLHMRHQILTWADLLERFGLVDYEMGFWERDILDELDKALRELGYEVVEVELTEEEERGLGEHVEGPTTNDTESDE